MGRVASVNQSEHENGVTLQVPIKRGD